LARFVDQEVRFAAALGLARDPGIDLEIPVRVASLGRSTAGTQIDLADFDEPASRTLWRSLHRGRYVPKRGDAEDGEEDEASGYRMTSWQDFTFRSTG
jgi:hypothetical protein